MTHLETCTPTSVIYHLNRNNKLDAITVSDATRVHQVRRNRPFSSQSLSHPQSGVHVVLQFHLEIDLLFKLAASKDSIGESLELKFALCFSQDVG